MGSKLNGAIDSYLNFDSHIKEIRGKVNQQTSALFRSVVPNLFYIATRSIELFKYLGHLSQNMNILYSSCSMIGVPQIFRNSIHVNTTYPVLGTRYRIIMVNVRGILVPCTSLLLLLLYTLIFCPSFKLKCASVGRYANFKLSIGHWNHLK